jgi:hypothetical protein
MLSSARDIEPSKSSGFWCERVRDLGVPLLNNIFLGEVSKRFNPSTITKSPVLSINLSRGEFCN